MTDSNNGCWYCGRGFSCAEIQWITNLIEAKPELTRHALSKVVCREFKWFRPDGGLKDMSCRVAMLKMHREGLITLPPPRYEYSKGNIRPEITSRSNPEAQICVPAGSLGELRYCIVRSSKDSVLWNELIERYHYLGYTPLAGAQLRYLVYSEEDALLAALGFGAAAWKVAPRDRFIEWSCEQRIKSLHMVVNNARFLILPWINSKNLASRILSGVARSIQEHWKEKYSYEPVLLETFVETGRFQGTCYRAANWIYVGQTQGRGKLDRKHTNSKPVKDIYLYPLDKQFRHLVCSNS
jgi:hypothetical protein